MGSPAEQEFKRQSYWRLVCCAKPYALMLTVGIVAGLLVGGSLFAGLLLIPRLMSVADSGAPRMSSAKVQKNTLAIVDALSKPGLSREEQIAVTDNILHPHDDDPQLTKLIDQARESIEQFHLPCEVGRREIKVFWPKEFTFQIVDEDGRVAWQLFAIYAAAFVLIWIVKTLMKYINGYCTRRVGSQVVADLRERAFNHLTAQSLSFYGTSDVGELISRITNDTQAMEDSISHSIEDLTSSPIQVIACVVAILVACKEYQSYSLALILLIGVPVLIVPVHILGRKIRKIYKKSFARIAEVFSRMHEVFSGIRIVKAYNTEVLENERFRLVNRSYLRQVIRALKMQLLVSPTMELIGVTAALVFLVYSYGQGVTLTELTALMAPAVMAYRPIKDISKVVAAVQRSMAAADRYFALIDVDFSLSEKQDAVELKEFRDRIELRDVCFNYDDRIILDHVNFQIPKGSVVAVVGETGSGKSTIANLIARFYDVSSGAVTIDGIDVRDCRISSLRRIIGVVNQDPVLFNETIADNIRYGKQQASMEEVIAAAKLANAHDFIVDGRHKEGYDTVVGEKGFRLSGGEKQRVAIARAILRNPPILILDEATSALDTVTERLVQEALNRVMANRTVFAIAHRLSTIQNADLIMVLKQGRIIEAGTHDELLKHNGAYRKLHDTQFTQK